jgi:hypothetical protein
MNELRPDTAPVLASTTNIPVLIEALLNVAGDAKVSTREATPLSCIHNLFLVDPTSVQNIADDQKRLLLSGLIGAMQSLRWSQKVGSIHRLNMVPGAIAAGLACTKLLCTGSEECIKLVGRMVHAGVAQVIASHRGEASGGNIDGDLYADAHGPLGKSKSNLCALVEVITYYSERTNGEVEAEQAAAPEFISLPTESEVHAVIGTAIVDALRPLVAVITYDTFTRDTRSIKAIFGLFFEPPNASNSGSPARGSPCLTLTTEQAAAFGTTVHSSGLFSDTSPWGIAVKAVAKEAADVVRKLIAATKSLSAFDSSHLRDTLKSYGTTEQIHLILTLELAARCSQPFDVYRDAVLAELTTDLNKMATLDNVNRLISKCRALAAAYSPLFPWHSTASEYAGIVSEANNHESPLFDVALEKPAAELLGRLAGAAVQFIYTKAKEHVTDADGPRLTSITTQTIQTVVRTAFKEKVANRCISGIRARASYRGRGGYHNTFVNIRRQIEHVEGAVNQEAVDAIGKTVQSIVAAVIDATLVLSAPGKFRLDRTGALEEIHDRSACLQRETNGEEDEDGYGGPAGAMVAQLISCRQCSKSIPHGESYQHCTHCNWTICKRCRPYQPESTSTHTLTSGISEAAVHQIINNLPVGSNVANVQDAAVSIMTFAQESDVIRSSIDAWLKQSAGSVQKIATHMQSKLDELTRMLIASIEEHVPFAGWCWSYSVQSMWDSMETSSARLCEHVTELYRSVRQENIEAFSEAFQMVNVLCLCPFARSFLSLFFLVLLFG